MLAGTAGLAALPALAQQAQKVEKIEVTGSNIKRVDAETAEPIIVISREEIQSVTPDAAKTRFVIIDAVGVCEKEFTDSPSLDRQPTVKFQARPQYPAEALDWLLPAGERAVLLEQVRELAATHPDLAGWDEFELPYVTVCARTSLA